MILYVTCDKQMQALLSCRLIWQSIRCLNDASRCIAMMAVKRARPRSFLAYQKLLLMGREEVTMIIRDVGVVRIPVLFLCAPYRVDIRNPVTHIPYQLYFGCPQKEPSSNGRSFNCDSNTCFWLLCFHVVGKDYRELVI